MDRNFSQTVTVRCSDPARLIEFVKERDVFRATTDISGYMGIRLLGDRGDPGRYVVIVDFGVIDPDVAADEEAARHSRQPETQAMAAALAEIVEDTPEYHDFDVLYSTPHPM